MNLKSNSHIALVDFDTPIVSSAASIQRNYITVTHTASGRKKEYDNITAFRAWLKDNEKWAEDQFTWESTPKLVEPVGHAIQIMKNKVESILAQPWCKDVKLFVGGKGNFRRDIYPEYKATRAAKPLAFKDVYDYAVKKWSDKIVICDGYEAEDHAAAEAYVAYLKCKEVGDRTAGGKVLCFVDKDLRMVSALHFDYNKPEEGVKWQDELSGYKCFAKQMLIGDRSTDNIRGVEVVTPEMKDVFGIKTKSIGEASAKKILDGLETEKDILERLVQVYKMAYKEEWKQMMDFTGKLVWITRHYKQPFDINYELERVGVMVNDRG